MAATRHFCPVHDVVGSLGKAAHRAEVPRKHRDAGRRLVEWLLADSIAGLCILKVDVGGRTAGSSEPVNRCMCQIALTVDRFRGGAVEAEE
jgi:hypothetical protein